MTPLGEQELHNLAMNIVGTRLEEMGYEFVAVNSTLKKHPQFVLFKKGEPTIFVLVKATPNLQNPSSYDEIWMQTFVEHKGSPQGKTITWVGDGNNMCHSYINAARQWDFKLNIACPKGFEPDSTLVADNKSRIELFEHPIDAVTLRLFAPGERAHGEALLQRCTQRRATNKAGRTGHGEGL